MEVVKQIKEAGRQSGLRCRTEFQRKPVLLEQRTNFESMEIVAATWMARAIFSASDKRDQNDGF
jgi:hypothetical protein